MRTTLVPHRPLGGGSCWAAVPRLEPWGALGALVVTAGMGKPQPEQGECRGVSAIPIHSWPRGGQHWESTHSHIGKHPKEPKKVLTTTGLGRMGCALSIAKCTR